MYSGHSPTNGPISDPGTHVDVLGHQPHPEYDRQSEQLVWKPHSAAPPRQRRPPPLPPAHAPVSHSHIVHAHDPAAQ